MTESKGSGNRLSWSGPIKSTLALSAITLLGYGCALSFQLGYLGAFGVPLYLIEIGLRESLLCAAITVAMFLLVFFVLGYIPARRWGGLLWQMLPIAGMAAMMWKLVSDDQNLFGDSTKAWFGLTAVLFSLAFVQNLVVPLRRRTGPLLERLHDEAVSTADPLTGSVAHAVIQSVNRGGFPVGSVAIACAFFIGVICLAYFSLGFEVSRLQVRFELVKASQPCIVVAKNGDTLVCAELSSSRKILTGAIVLLRTDVSNPLRLREVYLGHLGSAVDLSR